MRFAGLPACFLALVLTMTLSAVAEEGASPDEAKALALQAADLIVTQGLDGARTVLHQEGRFRHGELYVNVINTAGTWLVYPPTPASEGRSVLEIQDATGKFLVKDIIKTAGEQGEGWVEYRWANPVTRKVGPKVSYVESVPGTDFIVYVGVYK